MMLFQPSFPLCNTKTGINVCDDKSSNLHILSQQLLAYTEHNSISNKFLKMYLVQLQQHPSHECDCCCLFQTTCRFSFGEQQQNGCNYPVILGSSHHGHIPRLNSSAELHSFFLKHNGRQCRLSLQFRSPSYGGTSQNQWSKLRLGGDGQGIQFSAYSQAFKLSFSQSEQFSWAHRRYGDDRENNWKCKKKKNTTIFFKLQLTVLSSNSWGAHPLWLAVEGGKNWYRSVLVCWSELYRLLELQL